eukprot:SAG11_NODE_1087_length_5925_cov_2.708376_4_plen_361_part_00
MNNSGNGFSLIVDRLDNTSTRLSVQFVDCHAAWVSTRRGGHNYDYGANYGGFLIGGLVGTTGEVTVLRGSVRHSLGPALWVETKPLSETASVTFDGMQVIDSALGSFSLPARWPCLNDPHPICLTSSGNYIDIDQEDDANQLGGITLHNISVRDALLRAPLAVVDVAGTGIATRSIEGDLRVYNATGAKCSVRCHRCDSDYRCRPSGTPCLCNATKACRLPNMKINCQPASPKQHNNAVLPRLKSDEGIFGGGGAGLRQTRFLLLDKRVVDRQQGRRNASLVLGRATKNPANPLFCEDRPWEVAWLNTDPDVWYDNGIWKVFYVSCFACTIMTASTWTLSNQELQVQSVLAISVIQRFCN